MRTTIAYSHLPPGTIKGYKGGSIRQPDSCYRGNGCPHCFGGAVFQEQFKDSSEDYYCLICGWRESHFPGNGHKDITEDLRALFGPSKHLKASSYHAKLKLIAGIG